jgi:hypothetical protein
MFETDWGNTCLDLTRPAVTNYLAELVKTIHSWGVNYFKMDGLWTGSATEQIYVNDGFREDHLGENAPFYNPKITNLEAMRSGLKLLRQAAGPEVFFSGCNLSQNMRSLAGSIGLVDSMRIGPDNGQRWRDYHQEISDNASGSIITGPVRGTRLYFMHGRFWWNDPDPCYVRASIPLNQAQLITSWVAISGQFNLNSDWIPGLPPERLDLLKRTMPAHGAVARPVDYFDSVMPSTWLVTDTRQSMRRDVLGLFKFEVPAQSCRVLALRPAEEHPILISTSRHISQGIIDVSGEKWSSSAKTLSGTSQVVGRDPYELRIACLNNRQKKWKLISARVSGADAAAGVTITPARVRSNEDGWLRLIINTAASRSVHWSLRFNDEITIRDSNG